MLSESSSFIAEPADRLCYGSRDPWRRASWPAARSVRGKPAPPMEGKSAWNSVRDVIMLDAWKPYGTLSYKGIMCAKFEWTSKSINEITYPSNGISYRPYNVLNRPGSSLYVLFDIISSGSSISLEWMSIISNMVLNIKSLVKYDSFLLSKILYLLKLRSC